MTRSKKTRFSKNKPDQSPYFFPYTSENSFLACSVKIEYPVTQIHSLPCRKASDSGGRARTACGRNPAGVNKRLRQSVSRQNDSIKGASDKRPTGKRLLVSRFAITAAVTMILLSSHSHHAMGATRRDPRRGEIPVMRRPAAVCAAAHASGEWCRMWSKKVNVRNHSGDHRTMVAAALVILNIFYNLEVRSWLLQTKIRKL